MTSEATLRNCEKCHKKNIWRKQFRWAEDDDGQTVKEMRCRCGHWQKEEPFIAAVVPPKVLYVDIETAEFKMQINTFNLALRSGWMDWHDITSPFYIICWSACWWERDKKVKVISGAVTGKEAKKTKDKRCLQNLWKLMNDADYVVGHNSRAFDLKKIETRFILNGMVAPSDFQQRDTLTMAKKRFKPESQALDYWMRLLGGEQKEHMVKADWDAINSGCQKSINKMLYYNRGDIRRGVLLLNKFVEYCESNGGAVVFK